MSEKKVKPQKTLLGIFEILPDDIETDLDEMMEVVKKTIAPDGMVETYKIEPIAFGLKKVIARIMFKEPKEGGTQPMEDAIGAIELVQRVECSMVSIIS